MRRTHDREPRRGMGDVARQRTKHVVARHKVGLAVELDDRGTRACTKQAIRQRAHADRALGRDARSHFGLALRAIGGSMRLEPLDGRLDMVGIVRARSRQRLACLEHRRAWHRLAQRRNRLD